MHAESFARTKIQPPRTRPGLQARPALEARLERAFGEARLVLLAAPAGCGKTALLTRAFARLPGRSALAWVSLDEDDTLARLAACLVAALEPFDLPWRTAPEPLLQATGDGRAESLQALAQTLINAMAASDVTLGLIVLDDLHRVADPAVYRFLDLLIERLPAPWTVVLAGRDEPPIALPRLRASGAMLELRQADLGFSREEVRSLASQRGCDPSRLAEMVDSLHARTQGWPAGLTLLIGAGELVGPGPRLGSQRDRHAFDFIAAEVLQRMPPARRRFLVECSVLDELTEPTCLAVTRDPASGAHLAELERDGLFVSVLDAEQRTLKLHDLFRDCLDDLLMRESPAARPELLRRAAAIEVDPIRRIGLLLRAGDTAQAEREVDRLAPTLLTDGGVAPLQRLIGQFPAARQEASPHLLFARTLAAWTCYEWPVMRATSERAASACAAEGDVRGVRRARSYLGVALSALDADDEVERLVEALLSEADDDETRFRTRLIEGWTALSRGDTARLQRSYAQAVELMERIDRLPIWYEGTPLPSYIGLPGLNAPLRRYVAGAQRRLPAQPVPLSGMLQVTLGWLHLFAADWPALGEALAVAESEDRWLGQPTNLHLQQLMLRAMGCALHGDVDGARHANETLIGDYSADHGVTQRRVNMARLQQFAGRVAFIAGDAFGLHRWLGELEGGRHQSSWLLPAGHLDHLRALAARLDGDTARAVALWEQTMPDLARLDTFGQGVETRLRLADALLDLGRDAQAREVFEPAHRHVLDGGGPGHALMASPQVLRALHGAATSRGWDPAWCADLQRWLQIALDARHDGHDCLAVPDEVSPHALGHGHGAEPGQAGQAGQADRLELTEANPGPDAVRDLAAPGMAGPPSTTAPVDATARDGARISLSPREWEVLDRIAAGDSNKHIARAFDLSPHTVKRHVANILDKLGCDSRGQAAAWLRDAPQRSRQGV